jgi:hypothetical protein
MRIPAIMILDRDPDDPSEVINIEHSENTIIIHALENVVIALLDGDFPSGTLSFKAGQVIALPLMED